MAAIVAMAVEAAGSVLEAVKTAKAALTAVTAMAAQRAVGCNKRAMASDYLAGKDCG